VPASHAGGTIHTFVKQRESVCQAGGRRVRGAERFASHRNLTPSPSIITGFPEETLTLPLRKAKAATEIELLFDRFTLHRLDGDTGPPIATSSSSSVNP
jgi:hypothetical protein